SLNEETSERKIVSTSETPSQTAAIVKEQLVQKVEPVTVAPVKEVVAPVVTEPVAKVSEKPVVAVAVESKPAVTTEKGVPAAAYQILYLFQKEGRLLDFLMEDISSVDDDQLGGAIRPIHEGCRKILQERLKIEPVLQGPEGETVKVPEPHDPEEVKLTGNVPAKGPFSGTLVHRGWRLTECKLPELVAGWSGDVVAPAEVEIS
ncbi:MAG TPA: DUF2760 domain-containing protein, partial [Candidatus Ozemobacteraceae bacterium]|nr:DUF2760 domain-containing protein [Candidatus Ozemobacteraceae bacterium]